MTKEELRERALAARDALTEQERAAKDALLLEKLLGEPLWRQSGRILLYLSRGTEAGTRRIAEAALSAGKRVYAPVITDREQHIMEFHELASTAEVRPGAFGIDEPAGGGRFDPADPAQAEDALMLLPGAAFHTDGSRIGYGGGYYDRYLAKADLKNRVGICYDCQVTGAESGEHFPQEETDRRVEVIVTEKRTIRCGTEAGPEGGSGTGMQDPLF
ncbi:MAG: 5-formyltetrahydrofolate cyclo-ligase [Lachnospiraceae bacterium]|nr:5-formyltetrahydrofolate cyclo-ligase [Lachnospiraceae bacterium]